MCAEEIAKEALEEASTPRKGSTMKASLHTSRSVTLTTNGELSLPLQSATSSSALILSCTRLAAQPNRLFSCMILATGLFEV